VVAKMKRLAMRIASLGNTAEGSVETQLSGDNGGLGSMQVSSVLSFSFLFTHFIVKRTCLAYFRLIGATLKIVHEKINITYRNDEIASYFVTHGAATSCRRE
jgi:hypothetical protein